MTGEDVRDLAAILRRLFDETKYPYSPEAHLWQSISQHQAGRVRKSKTAPAVFALIDPDNDLTKPLPNFPECVLCGFDRSTARAQKHKILNPRSAH